MTPLRLFAGVVLGSLCLPLVQAEETWSEKAKARVNDAGRAAKKHVHRAQEAMCRKDDTECLRLKAKHRAEEIGEEIQDKASEIKGKLD